jgi:hypothetical protein
LAVLEIQISKPSRGLALLHNSQAVDNKNEFLWHFYNNFRLSQGQLKTYATTPRGLHKLTFWRFC